MVMHSPPPDWHRQENSTVVPSLFPFRMQVLESRMPKKKKENRESQNSLRKNSSFFYLAPWNIIAYIRESIVLSLLVAEFMNSSHEMNYNRFVIYNGEGILSLSFFLDGRSTRHSDKR